MNNLFANVPEQLSGEWTEILAEGKSIRIERIVTIGQSSPEGFWYDQEDEEWVVVLRGAAQLLFEGDSQPILLTPGDFLNIPAHRKHRVEWVTPNETTLWLAVFYAATPRAC